MNTTIVFSPVIAGILIKQGFEVVKERPDYKNPRHWVYFFEDTPEFREAFDVITSQQDK